MKVEFAYIIVIALICHTLALAAPPKPNISQVETNKPTANKPKSSTRPTSQPVSNKKKSSKDIWMFSGEQWNVPALEFFAQKFGEPRKLKPSDFYVFWICKTKQWQQYSAGKTYFMTVYAKPNDEQKKFIATLKPQPEMLIPAYGKAVIIVNRNNKLDSLTSNQVRDIFRQTVKRGKKYIPNKITWEALGSNSGEIRWYDANKYNYAILIVNHACMCVDAKKKPNWFYSFRKDATKKETLLEVVNSVKHDPNGIAIIPWQPDIEKLLTGVKVLSIAGSNNKIPVKPTLAPVIDENYPLIEPMVIFLHPKTKQTVKDFCKWLFEPEGRAELEKFGLITPYAEKQYLAEKYVKMMKAGEGPSVGMTGLVNLRDLAKALILESVKSNGPVQLKFSEATESTAVNSFLNRDDVYMLLLDSKPSERTMKLVTSSWGKVKPIEYVIGGEAMAMIVNPANTVSSLTSDQVRGLFSRQIKDWRFVAAKTKEGGGNSRVECFGERLNTPAAKLFMDTVMPSRKISGVKYRKTAGGVIASVAMDAGGVGFANAALIDPDDKAIKILPIGPLGKAVLPTDETIINGQYPFSRRLYLYVKPNAPEAVKTIVKFLLSPEAAEAFKTNGYFPAPQPKPAPQSQPVKSIKKPATRPATTTSPTKPNATTQPTSKPVTPTTPVTQPAKSKAA